jgi:acetoin utilization deacetylase AcuC-like enzyme
MSSPQFTYFYHPVCARHDMGAGHPEQPKRVLVVHDALSQAGLIDEAIEAPLVTRAQGLRVHTEAYWDELEAADALAQQQEQQVQLDPDTSLNAYSMAAAKRAAGAGVAAVDWVLQDVGPRRAFCNVRPPGHHALPGAAMGFCIIHSAAVAVAHALAAHGLSRVALVDFDVHHGNGSEAMFAGHAGVRFYSSFQYPYYPHSGVPARAANIINAPLPWGAGSSEIRTVFERDFLPDLHAYAPELVVISAGFDAHKDDPLAGLNFATDDYAWISEQLVGVANAHAGGKMVSMLEGGYSLSALAESAVAHVRALQS